MTKEAWEEVVNAQPHHKARLSHELIAAAAAYEAMKAYNDHKAKHGEQVEHAMAKQIMAAASAAFIDRMIETKGLDAIDRVRAKHAAEKAHDTHLHHHHGHHHGHHRHHHS